MRRYLNHGVLVGAMTLIGASGTPAEPLATVTIRADEPGPAVSSNLFGAFFEEINYAGEGGLYAEMVRNRAFHSSKPDFWSFETQGDAVGTMTVDATAPLNDATSNSLRLTMTSGAGVVEACNAGFWGMSLAAGATYNLNLFAKGAADVGPVEVRLESANGGRVYAKASFAGLTGTWQHFSNSLVSSGTDTNARLVVAISRPGTIWLDVVSLFPQATFHGRENGLRLDLAEKIADLHPSFLRFPGGNFIESYHVANALRWKTTIGDVAERPGHFNDSWGYWSTDGFGAHEFFQFCEDVGMEPLYAVNAGLMLNYADVADNTVPLDQLRPWVQDALDLVEYANGGPDTPWGARRVAAGHPAPFNLKYLEIGNENGGPLFDERYSQFYDALKSNCPSIHLIVPGNWAGGKPWSRPVEIADEHYYDNPENFLNFATKYDSYSRQGPKIFVGEYAVTSGYGAYGNLAAALGEAAFMTGLERNSDLVKMASYAPLLANVNDIQWRPDLIYFNGGRSFGTPSYYVQQLFSRNRGDMVLPAVVNVSTNSPWFNRHGAVGLGSWNTSVEYADLEVKSGDRVLFKDDFDPPTPAGWRVFRGNWSAVGGAFKQSDATLSDCRATVGNTNWADYSISLRARKTRGAEGFLILFNWLDDDNWTWLNVGGWGNTLTAVEQCGAGTKLTLGVPAAQSVLANTWYDIQIVLNGPRIRCYVNSNLIQDVTYPDRVFVSSTYAKAVGQIVVKAVNPYNTPVITAVHVAGVDSVAPEATLVQLRSASAADENSFESPRRVFPVTNTLSGLGADFTMNLPANSLSVLRLRAAGLKTVTNLSLQVPVPLKSGQVVPAMVWGRRAGASAPVNLTANENHALTYFSDNPAVATVDCAGRVTGLTGGVADIVANYESLGLSATQAVRVVSVPVQLVHRYSFNEAAGTNCADSVGGPVWNGRLPAGGAIGGGQLTLAAANSQYLQLPAGILSNYTAVTIDAWVSFANRLAKDCFFFGFGSTNGADGDTYIFCAPQAGRVAITDGNYAREQNAFGSADFSFHQNVHLTAVFDPPEGYIALYTNGVLAGVNRNVTTPMSLVHDACSYIGRSLYAADPYADLSLAEFRIYNGALTARDIAKTQALGPRRLPAPGRIYSRL